MTAHKIDDEKMDNWPNAPARAALMYQAAQMYFLHDVSRSAIGQALGISRFKVARLLDEARQSGLINIIMTQPDGLDPERARIVAEKWGLDRAIVVPYAPEEELLHLLSAAVASYWEEHLRDNDVLGLPAGRIASRAARLVRFLPRCTVVQIAGVASAATLWESTTETIRRMAQLTFGPSFPIFAPMVLNSKLAAEILRQEPAIAAAYSYFPLLTKAIVSIGSWQKHLSMVYDSAAPDDIALVKRHHPVAEILANILNSEGEEVAKEFSDRALTISLAQLRQVPDVIGIVGGVERQRAALAALQANFINTLITDSMTAQFLINNAP